MLVLVAIPLPSREPVLADQTYLSLLLLETHFLLRTFRFVATTKQNCSETTEPPTLNPSRLRLVPDRIRSVTGSLPLSRPVRRSHRRVRSLPDHHCPMIWHGMPPSGSGRGTAVAASSSLEQGRQNQARSPVNI
eukprot:762514-Hanusia_phi.AAC.8